MDKTTLRMRNKGGFMPETDTESYGMDTLIKKNKKKKESKNKPIHRWLRTGTQYININFHNSIRNNQPN